LKVKGEPVAWPKGQKLSEEHKAKLTRRQPVPPGIADWVPLLKELFDKLVVGPRVAEETFLELAGRLVLFGSPRDREGRIAFEHLTNLLFCRYRLDFRKGESLRKHVDFLPTTREELNRVIAAVIIAEKKLGPLSKRSFSVKNFITVALQIPSARFVGAYISKVLESALSVKTVSSIFSPNVFEFTRPYLRGMNPYGPRKGKPRGSPEDEAYRKQNAAAIAALPVISCGPELSRQEQQAIFDAQVANIPWVE
jgi:hypothetical protein